MRWIVKYRCKVKRIETHHADALSTESKIHVITEGRGAHSRRVETTEYTSTVARHIRYPLFRRVPRIGGGKACCGRERNARRSSTASVGARFVVRRGGGDECGRSGGGGGGGGGGSGGGGNGRDRRDDPSPRRDGPSPRRDGPSPRRDEYGGNGRGRRDDERRPSSAERRDGGRDAERGYGGRGGKAPPSIPKLGIGGASGRESTSPLGPPPPPLHIPGATPDVTMTPRTAARAAQIL